MKYQCNNYQGWLGENYMNIFEYLDKKRNEYERLRDESQLQLKTNRNRIQKISLQIEEMMEKEENPSQFFLPEITENYKEEIESLQEKKKVLEAEDELHVKKVELCEKELYLLDTLELPDFSSAKNDAEWKPMRVSEEEFQIKNVSRETIEQEDTQETEQEEITENVSRETINDSLKEKIHFCRQIAELDPRRCGLMLDEVINEIS